MITERQVLEHSSKCFYIDPEGLDHLISAPEAILKIAQGKSTVKLEGFENHINLPKHITDAPHTVHIYISPKGAKSFPTHKDPYPVHIHCLSGIKVMEVDSEIIEIRKGETLKIETNQPHRAINRYDSIMASVGYDVT